MATDIADGWVLRVTISSGEGERRLRQFAVVQLTEAEGVWWDATHHVPLWAIMVALTELTQWAFREHPKRKDWVMMQQEVFLRMREEECRGN